MPKRNNISSDKELEELYTKTSKALKLTDEKIIKMLRKTRKNFRFA